ncbi:MAG TPA: MFS transporter [Geobacteraceae bacterium]
MKTRWKIFAILSFMYVLAYFFRVSMAVAARDLAADLHLSAAQLGTLSGAFFYAFAFTQIPLGPLLDRFGGHRVVTACGLITTAGSLLFACAPGYPAALAGRILLGAGSASVLMGALKVFTNWFTPREFATISGLIVAIGNLGNLSATAPLALAIAAGGWRQPFVAVGLLQLAATLGVHLIVQDRPQREDDEKEPAHHHPGVIAGWRMVAATPSFWLLSLLAFFWYANYMALQGLWGGPYLMEVIGLSRKGAGDILLLTSVGFIVGCLCVGKLSDRLLKSRKWTLVAGQTALLLLMTAMLGPADSLGRPLLSALFAAIGLAVSSGVTIYPMLREMFPHAITGTALTAANFFVLMGAATMQQLMGHYIEGFSRSPSGYPAAAYHGAFLIPIGGLALAILLFLGARDTSPERP